MRRLPSPRVPPALRLALALLLLLGQAALFAHDARHLDAGDVQHVCLVCLAGHGVDTPAPAAAAPALPLVAASCALPPAAPLAGDSAAAVRAAARGPPGA